MLTSAALLYSFTAVCAACCGKADGYAYETNPTVWVSDSEWIEEADGSRWQRPLRFACVAELGDFERVEEEDEQ